MRVDRIFFYLVRPGLVLRKLRERRRANSSPKSRLIATDQLPEVVLQLANGDDSLEHDLLEMFQRNPSPMVIAPETAEGLQAEMARGTQYYLVLDQGDTLLGCLGWQQPRSRVVHIIVDYKARSRGLALAAVRELLRMKRNAGVGWAFTQVFRENWRAYNLMQSLGFEDDPDAEASDAYYSLRLRLNTESQA